MPIGVPIAELRSVACSMSVHSVTCHPIQVNMSHLNSRQTDRYPGGMLGWVDLMVGYIPRWFTCCRQSPIQVLTGPSIEQLAWLRSTCWPLHQADTRVILFAWFWRVYPISEMTCNVSSGMLNLIPRLHDEAGSTSARWASSSSTRAASWMFAILHHSNDQIASSSSQLVEERS